MSTPANIIIQNKKKEKYYGNGSDEELVFVQFDGRYYGFHGVIRTLIKAYNNEDPIYWLWLRYQKSIPKQDLLNLNVRSHIEFAASSIVHVGVGNYLPVSRLGYEEYAKQGWFYDYAFQFLITISDEKDKDGDIIWEITLKGKRDGETARPDITRTVKEWQKFSELDIVLDLLREDYSIFELIVGEEEPPNIIKESIYLGEVSPLVLSSVYGDIGPSPCDQCLTRSTCVRKEEFWKNLRIRHIKRTCDKWLEYVERLRPCILEKLSYDKQLQGLLERACSERYFQQQ